MRAKRSSRLTLWRVLKILYHNSFKSPISLFFCMPTIPAHVLAPSGWDFYNLTVRHGIQLANSSLSSNKFIIINIIMSIHIICISSPRPFHRNPDPERASLCQRRHATIAPNCHANLPAGGYEASACAYSSSIGSFSPCFTELCLKCLLLTKTCQCMVLGAKHLATSILTYCASDWSLYLNFHPHSRYHCYFRIRDVLIILKQCLLQSNSVLVWRWPNL